jgi:hypothetical protein
MQAYEFGKQIAARPEQGGWRSWPGTSSWGKWRSWRIPPTTTTCRCCTPPAPWTLGAGALVQRDLPVGVDLDAVGGLGVSAYATTFAIDAQT